MPQDPVSDFLAQDATSLVRQKADEYGVPADFAERILNKETRKRADIITGRTRSPKGATGAMQLMPETAARLGVQDPTDYTQNIDGGVRELARLYKQYNGDQSLVAAGYNAGEGAVKKYGGKVPPYRETQDYVKEVASDPVQDFLNGSAAGPAATPQKMATPRPVKTESEYPVLRAPSDVSTALFDWRSGGTQGILADSDRNAEVVKEAQRNQSPQRQRERASAVASGQNALERGASQFFNAAAKGVARIPQNVAELSDLVGEYQPAARLGNAIQGMVTGQKPQRLAPQIAPYTQQVEAAIDRDVPVDANDPSWVTAKIPRAVGGLAPFIAGGALSGGSRAVTGVLGAAGNAGDIGKEFDEAGGDPANRDKAIALAAATGLSEVLGVGKLLAKFGTNQGVMQAAKTVLEEGGQEAFQQWVNNLNAANVGAYDPNRSQTEGVGEAAVLGGLLGGGLSGVSNIAARRAQQPQIDRAPAPIAPGAPRSADTNLNPDEVLTPATGAQPIIDPVTGIPQAEVSNPVTDAKVEDIFAHPLFGRKPNPAVEKAKVKAQEAQAYRQAATEAAAAGDVGRQMDALQEALQRETDPQARLDLKAELRTLQPGPAAKKPLGQGAPLDQSLLSDKEMALPEDAADAPTAGLTGDLMSPQEVKAAAPVAGVLGTLQQYKGEVPTLIAAGKFNEAKALIKEMDAFLKVERKKVPPEALSSEYGQRILKDGRELGAFRDMLANRMQAVAAEKTATPAKAPRAATPKTPKGPKVVTPKAEGVRRGQGVLKGVVPDQPDLIDNVAAMENRQGGIPPVEPVAGNVLPFEELADRAKAKVNKRANMSPVEYLKQASQGEGFRVMDSGEAEGVSAKDAKIVAFTNQNSQYGMNDAAVMLDEGGYFLPDGRRFTDQDVKEADVLDYLKQYGKQSSAGNTGGVDPRIAAEEAAYYEQRAASEGAPTTSTRLPSGLIAESRRPQPIETPRSTPDYRQKALDRINAAELPDNAKQRYRDWLEQGRLTDSDVLNDPDLAPVAQRAPAAKSEGVIWRNQDSDIPVRTLGQPETGPDGRQYVQVEGSTPETADYKGFAPVDELQGYQAPAPVESITSRKPVEQVQQVEMRRTGTDNAPVVEMPKRATPPQPIPEELSRVYGGKIAPEQAEAIQRRRDLRESVDKGAYGKFSAIARRSFASEATGEALPPLAAHPEIRRILGLPEMPSYKVEDGRVSNNWQKATQHTMDALAEMVGIERSSLSDIDALHELQSAIARRSSNQSLHEVFAATMAGTDMALQRADVLLSHPAVESVIEKILDRQASSGKSLGNRGSLREELQEALATAQDEANKTGTPVYNYDKEDIAAIAEGAIKAFEADIGTRRVLEGRPQEYLAKLHASRNRSADASGKQSAASPAESPAGRAPAPAQESPQLQAPTEIVESTSDRKGLTVPEGANRIGQNADSISQSSEGQSMKQPGSQIYYHGERRVGDVKEGPKLGRFLTTERKIAEKYANNKGRVLAYEADVRSPLKVEGIDPVDPTIFTPEQMNEVMKKAGVKYKFPDNIDEQEFWRYIDDGGKRLVSAVKQAGYDALVFPDVQGARYFDTTLVFDEGKLRTAAEPQAPTEIVEPREGGYVRKNGRIYEIVKYHPKEGTVWIQEPGSPGAQAIPQSEVRKITIPDDVAKAEIGEAAKEGQPSQDQPKTSGRKEAPEVEDGTPEIGEGIRRAAEEAKRKLRKPGAVKAEAPAELQQIEHLTPEQIVQVTSQEAADYYQRQIGRQLKDSEKSALKATHERVVRKARQNGEVIHPDVLAEYPSIDKPILKPTKSSDQPAEADLQQIYRAARSVDHVDADYFQEQVENADANVTWNQIAKGLRNVGASPEDVVKIFDKAGFKHPVANPDITEAEALRREREALDAIGKSEAEESGRQPKGPSQVEYRGSGPNIVQEVKNLVVALSGRSLSKKYKLPADQGKLRAEIDDVVKIVKRYAKAREDAGLPIDPELAKSLSDSAQKIATAFQSGDQKGYQNARKAIDDAFVKYGVEAPSFASTRREALKTWEKYQKAQEAAGKPLSKEYAAALIDIEQRLRFANRDGDVQAYQKAKRDLNWLTQKIEAKEDPATLGDRLLTLRAGAHFLNPKFVIRNVLSQPIVWGGDKIDNAVAATISKLAAAVRGKKAVVGFDDFSTLGSLREGAELAREERKQGKSIDPAYGLHPHAFSDKTALGKTGRVLEDALFFINRLPDDAFYHGYFTAKLNDLAQQYKGSKEVSLDQIIDQAHLEANKLAMRDKNWVSENLKRMQRGLNRISTFNKSEKIGLGTLVLNYAQYPGSTLKRAMEHSPLGLIDVAIEANRPGPFRERNVINALSRSLTGSAFTFGVGTLLGASGVMTGGLPDDDKEKKRLREIGYKPYQLNVSALKRWFTSGFQKQQLADGDNLVSLDWAQPWAMLLAAGTATSHAWSREMSRSDKAQETAKAMYDSIASFMDTLGDQSVVKNLTRYMETAERAVKYGESGTLAVARDIADDIVSSNVPVVLNQVRQYADPVNRSTWAEEMEDGKSVRKKGWPGFLEETILRRPQSRIPYVAENGIPGLMRGLPPIPGSRKQVTYNPQLENNNWMNAFVNPSNLSTIRPEDERDRKLLDRAPQPRKKEEKKRKPIERVKM